MASSQKYFWCLTFVTCYLVSFVYTVSSSFIDDVKIVNHLSPVKKNHKKLKKEEGAIRLVGGSNDYEGSL